MTLGEVERKKDDLERDGEKEMTLGEMGRKGDDIGRDGEKDR